MKRNDYLIFDLPIILYYGKVAAEVLDNLFVLVAVVAAAAAVDVVVFVVPLKEVVLITLS